jgi:hypothetical protein
MSDTCQKLSVDSDVLQWCRDQTQGNPPPRVHPDDWTAAQIIGARLRRNSFYHADIDIMSIIRAYNVAHNLAPWQGRSSSE